VQFQWTAGAGPTAYTLQLGTTGVGASNLYSSGVITATTVTVPTLPSNGVTIFARLYQLISGVWQSTDYVYTESGTSSPAVLTTPTPGLGTILGTSNVQFQWTPGSGPANFILYLGTTAPGSTDIYASVITPNTSVTVPSIPANGVKVYARLFQEISGVYQYSDYVYTEQ
jgi:hypothetical protein